MEIDRAQDRRGAELIASLVRLDHRRRHQSACIVRLSTDLSEAPHRCRRAASAYLIAGMVDSRPGCRVLLHRPDGGSTLALLAALRGPRGRALDRRSRRARGSSNLPAGAQRPATLLSLSTAIGNPQAGERGDGQRPSCWMAAQSAWRVALCGARGPLNQRGHEQSHARHHQQCSQDQASLHGSIAWFGHCADWFARCLLQLSSGGHRVRRCRADYPARYSDGRADRSPGSRTAGRTPRRMRRPAHAVHKLSPRAEKSRRTPPGGSRRTISFAVVIVLRHHPVDLGVQRNRERAQVGMSASV